ncbi:FecR domain-containing protein [Calycomorphotria hydatis]|uniref:FecR protein n=1 Tax=Calycomorphotria hydatis TaxID=2528027 RepID=A0A517TBK0_9PLAN|nr:FecR domain-containing protein [Calycomorphotria hydatis]QDT65743.1 FecR protein [Calycomorphotria hydatis]
MSTDAQIRNEITKLAGAMCAGNLDTEDGERLEEILMADVRHAQWYVEYMAVHSKLIGKSWEDLSAEQVKNITTAPQQSVNLLRRWPIWVAGISSMALLLLIGAAVTLMQPPIPSAGKLIGLTANATWDGRQFMPGDLILQGGKASLETGIASFEMNDGAVVSIEGPATITAIDGGKTQLVEGLLHAVVPKRAIGYKVETTDTEIVDLGTEFSVELQREFGTRVIVRSGRVEASTVDADGQPSSLHLLTAGRAMLFHANTGVARELVNSIEWDEKFEEFERARGGVQRLDGIVRTTPSRPADLRTDQLTTSDYILLIKECSGIQLTEDLILHHATGESIIEAGTLLDSYLLHFNPSKLSTAPPLGTITFDQPIQGIAATTDDLIQTDQICESSGYKYSTDLFRGLEFKEDQLEISADRRSVTFHFIRAPLQNLDQCRVFVKHVPVDGSTSLTE